MAALAVERDWRAEAACAGYDPELFFPLTAQQVEAAKQVCRDCPVRAECRQWADREGITYGVWGAESEEERRKRLTGAPAGEGTAAVCEQCRLPYRRRRTGQRFCCQRCHHLSMSARAAAAAAPCGTTGAARRHRKRGEPLDPACRMADSLYRARLRARRQEAAGVAS